MKSRMKRFRRFLMVIGLGLFASGMQAQQVQGDFDQAWVTCSPYTGGETKSIGTQPVGWTASNIAGYKLFGSMWLGATEVVKGVIGRNEAGYAASMVNSPNTALPSQIVPAYLTLGTSWNTANLSGNEADGGSFGGIDFAYRPDAMHLYYKRSVADAAQPASVIAYLWSGTFSQADVPVNVAQSPTKVTMVDRDRNILGKSTDKGGAVTNDNGKLVASLEYYISETNAEWQELTVPFDYKDLTTAPQKLNIILSANNYFGSKADVIENNTLIVDDVTLVYYSTLSDLKYDGAAIIGFAENTKTYDMSSVTYEESLLAYTAKSRWATTSHSFDQLNGLLTITVTGNDRSKTDYKVQFAVPKVYTGKLSSLTVNEAPIELVEEQYYYTVVGERSGSSIQWVAEDGEDAIVTEDYSANTRISTIHVQAGDKENTYFVKFAKETTGYTGKMFIEMNMGGNSLLSAASETVGISAPVEEKADFQLLNFSLAGIGKIGDIFVTDVPYVPATDGSVTLHKEQTIVIFGDAGAALGNLPVVLNGNIVNGELTATIDILWESIPIQVNVYPFSTTSIDLSDVASTGAVIGDIQADLTNPNCLIYLAAGEIVEASVAQNVVIGDQASDVVITDGTAFHAPKAFTANSVSYTRNCYIDGGWETIMLPFAPTGVTVAGVADNEYRLEKCSGRDEANESVNFIAATEWQANTPYIFRASDNSGADGAQKEYVFSATGSVAVAATTEGSYTQNGFKGVYDNLPLEAAGAGYLLKADGNSFALCAANSNVLPFRAYIQADGVVPTALKITRQDPVGIDSENVSNQIYADGNAIIVKAAQAQTIVINDLTGRTIRTLDVVEGTTTISGVASGFYIVNGQKVLVK